VKASRPSATARLIAAATVLSSRDPREQHLVPDASAVWSARLLSTSWRDRLLLATVGTRTGRSLWRLVERVTLPGVIRHYAVRKAVLEGIWRDARAEGFSQLVVLGAGLDTLGLRVAQAERLTQVVELDHPATQSIKALVLNEAGAPALRLVEGRLDRPGWSSHLLDPGSLDASRSTLVVLEGVSMYLRADEMSALLTELRTLPVPRLRLAFTLFDRPDAGPVGFRPASRAVALWLGLVGEPFRWACGTETLGPFLASAGLQLVRRVPAAEMHACVGLSVEPLLEGEDIAVAERVD
jgi:methyltransferase (TIGR00027 family)